MDGEQHTRVMMLAAAVLFSAPCSTAGGGFLLVLVMISYLPMYSVPFSLIRIYVHVICTVVP